ncbi:uncharacterized protein LOC120629090 isoform X2 [Pararge aegeria]|uniref:uncharacterized protein LOC120629090 isoform X2 n=1 Tax=Pararge aegeria TaxID=116150 RepID=UPI0019D12550|nr:uncharacterized protein LOC120629090 isoform X2 [Pararge aegeria]
MDKKEEIKEHKPDLTNNTKMREYCGNSNNVESTNGTLESVPTHPTINDFIKNIRELQIITPEEKHNDETRGKPQNNYVCTEELKQSKEFSKYAFTEDQTSVAHKFNQTSTPQYVFGHPAVTQPSSSENTAIFNSSELMTLFSDTWKLGSSPTQNKMATMAALKSSFSEKKSQTNSPTAKTELKPIKPSFTTDQQNAISFFVFGGQKTLGSIYNKKFISHCKFGSPQATMKSSSENTASVQSLFHKTAKMSTLYSGSRKYETSRTQKKTVKPSEILNSPTASTTFKTVIPTFCTAQQNDTSFYVFGGQKKSTTLCIFSPPSATTITTSEKSASAESLLNKTVLMTLFDETLNFGTSTTPTPKLSLANSTVISFPFNGILTRQAQLVLTRTSYELQKIKINLYKYEDYKSAIAMFVDAIHLCPDHVPFYAIKCHYYMKLGMYKEAMKDAQKIIEFDSESTYGVIYLAKCYIALGYIPGAPKDISTDDMQSLLQGLEELFELYINIQRATSLDDYTGALASTDRFLELCPSSKVKASKATCLAMLGQFEQALEIAEECLLSDVSEPDALNAKGLCYYYNGQFAQAVDYFKQVITLCPSHWGAIESLKKTNKFMSLSEEGAEALKQGDYSKVIRLNNVLLTDKLNIITNLKLYCSNAAMYLKLNELKLAIGACTAAVGINENCVDALRMRAKCYNKLGKYEDAVRDLEKVRDISRSVNNCLEGAQILAVNKEKVLMVSDVERLVESQKFKEALKLADDYLQKHKYHTELLYTKGLCFYYMGEYEKALENFLQVLNIQPKHGKALPQFKKTVSLKRALERGNELFNSGRWQEALYEFKKALEIDIGNLNLIIKVHCKNAEIYLQLNQINEAINEYEHVLTFDNNCVEALLKRAKCYTEVERYESAIIDYEKITTIVDSEETKQSAGNFVITLKEKLAHKEKGDYAEILMQSQKIENLKLALKFAEECLQFDSSDINALFVKGMCLYFKEQYDQALDQFQRVLLLKPSHPLALEKSQTIPPLKRSIERANNSALTGQWQDALDHFSEALTMDMCNKNLRVRLFCEVAAMHSKLNQRFRAVEAYSNALMVDANCLDALRARAKCYTEDQRYESAIEDYEKITTIVENEETKQSARYSIISLKEKIAFREKSKHAMTLMETQKPEDLEVALKLAEECMQFDSSDTNARCVKGTCLYYKDEYEKALHQFQQVLILKPSHTMANELTKKISWLKRTMEKANNSFLKGRWEDAFCHFSEALTIDACNRTLCVKLYCKIAAIHSKLNQKLQAIEAYSNALMLDENCTQALFERSTCYIEGKKYESAIEDLEKIATITDQEETKKTTRFSITLLKEQIAFREKSKHALSLKESTRPEELELALKLAEECLQFDSSDINARCVKGTCLFYKDQYEQALEEFQRVLLLEPSHSTALKEFEKITWFKQTIERGNYSLMNGQWIDALCNFSEALTIDMCSINIRVRLFCKKASMHSKLNQRQQAIEAYSNALMLDEKCLDALRERAKCYKEDQRYESAIEDYEIISTIAENEEIKQSARKSLTTLKEKILYLKKSQQAETLMRSEKTEELELALKLAEECLQFDSSDTNVLCVKGICLYYKDQYEQALHQFQKVLLLEPSHSTALKETEKISSFRCTLEKANNSVLTGRWQDALDYFNEALLTNDMCYKKLRVKLYCKTAEMYLKLNNTVRAVEAYSNALMLDKECLEALLERAKCYAEDQKYDSAIEDYEKIFTQAENEDIKQLACNAIKSIKSKIAYKEKSEHAMTLVSTPKPKELQLAQKLAEECLQFDSSDTNALFVKGTCLYYEDRYQEAINQFQQILNLNPSHKKALDTSKDLIWLQSTIEKGDHLLDIGGWQVALYNLNEGLKIYSHNTSISSKLHYQKASLYCILNKKHQAIEAYSAAIELVANSPLALRDRARCYTEVENYEDAMGDYKKLHEIYQDEQLKQWTLDCIKNLKDKMFHKAKIEYAEALILSQKSEKLEHAIKLAEESLQFDSSDQRALCVKGCCLYYMEKYDQALDQFKQVLLIKPSHSLALKETKKITGLKSTINEANDALKTQRWQDALVTLKAALNIDENNKNLKVKLCCKIGNAYFHLNQKLQAIKAYTEALFYDANCINALRGRANCLPDVGKYDEALRDYEKLHEIEQSDETKKYLDQAKSAYLYSKFIKEKIEAGNTFFEQNKLKDALRMYKEAAECNPEKTEYYYNQFSLNIARCYIGLGDLSAAERAIIKARGAGNDCTDDQRVLESLQRYHAQAQKYIDEQSYDRAISSIDKCLVSSPFSNKAKLIKAECLVKLGKNDQALQIAEECIRSDHSDVEAVFVKGICLYYNEKLQQALKYFKEVLRLSPDHAQAAATYKKAKLLDEKKIQGNDEFKKGQWRKALGLYEEALKIDATQVKVNSKLHFNRAAVYVKLNQTHEAAEACIKALELDENYVKALNLRAKCFTELKDYDSAVEDYEHLKKIDPSDEIERLLREAKLSQKKESKRQNYYHILGINLNATKSDIVQAYKKLAMIHHPDRHVDRSEFERKRQKRRFQLVSEAYNVLSDPNRRHKYDAYED